MTGTRSKAPAFLPFAQGVARLLSKPPVGDISLRRSLTMTEPSNFVFGVDLDGVCADYYEGIRPIAAEWLGVDEIELKKNVTFDLKEWGIPEGPGAYPDFHKFAVTQRDLFKILMPIRDCPQALRRLSKAGIRIRIITHRLFIRYFHLPAINQTIEWLDFHGIPYWDLCFMGEKGAVGAHVYIEDSPANIERLRKEKLDVIVFANSTNSGLKDKTQRVKTWLEVERLVMQKFAKWKEDVDKASKPPPPSLPKK
jgi:5'(3')-deoxyribonucleotidase